MSNPKTSNDPKVTREKLQETIWGAIAAVYGDLDEDDCTWVDMVWANQRGLTIAPKPPAATVENKTGDQVHWLKVNDEPFEYAIQQGSHGDEFVKLLNGERLRRPLQICSAGADDALGYAQRLATILWEKHWKDDAPNWKPLPDLVGVLTQIDNSTAGLIRAVPQTVQEPTVWLIEWP